MTEEGDLYSPIKTQSDSQAVHNQIKGQASEDYVKDQLGDDFIAQQSYQDGVPIKGKPAGSVRPDFCSMDGSCSIEVKNYDLNRSGGESSLVNNIAEQAVYRKNHLPSGMTQMIKIDIRGQNVSTAKKIEIIEKIVNKSNGSIDFDSIEFIE